MPNFNEDNHEPTFRNNFQSQRSDTDYSKDDLDLRAEILQSMSTQNYYNSTQQNVPTPTY